MCAKWLEGAHGEEGRCSGEFLPRYSNFLQNNLSPSTSRAMAIVTKLSLCFVPKLPSRTISDPEGRVRQTNKECQTNDVQR